MCLLVPPLTSVWLRPEPMLGPADRILWRHQPVLPNSETGKATLTVPPEARCEPVHTEARRTSGGDKTHIFIRFKRRVSFLPTCLRHRKRNRRRKPDTPLLVLNPCCYSGLGAEPRRAEPCRTEPSLAVLWFRSPPAAFSDLHRILTSIR